MAYTGFDKLKAKLSNEKGVTDPGGLAYTIGAKKYGKRAMKNAARNGKTLRSAKPKTY